MPPSTSCTTSNSSTKNAASLASRCDVEAARVDYAWASHMRPSTGETSNGTDYRARRECHAAGLRYRRKRAVSGAAAAGQIIDQALDVSVGDNVVIREIGDL